VDCSSLCYLCEKLYALVCVCENLPLQVTDIQSIGGTYIEYWCMGECTKSIIKLKRDSPSGGVCNIKYQEEENYTIDRDRC
jgi:hypothetical protein